MVLLLELASLALRVVVVLVGLGVVVLLVKTGAMIVRMAAAVAGRLAVAAGAATLAGSAAGVAVASIATQSSTIDAGTVATAVGWGLLPFTILAIFRWWPLVRPTRRPVPTVTAPPKPIAVATARKRQAPITPTAPPVPAAAPVPPGRPERSASPLDRAWDAAAGLAPSGALHLGGARGACTALLARAAADPLDWSLTEWAQVIEVRVPELVAAATALHRIDRGAGAPAALLDDLAAIAAEARARLHPGRPRDSEADARGRGDKMEADAAVAARTRFATLRAYVASRTRDKSV